MVTHGTNLRCAAEIYGYPLHESIVHGGANVHPLHQFVVCGGANAIAVGDGKLNWYLVLNLSFHCEKQTEFDCTPTPNSRA